MQDILVYVFVIGAVAFLLKKFVFKYKKKRACGDDHNCKCG